MSLPGSASDRNWFLQRLVVFLSMEAESSLGVDSKISIAATEAGGSKDQD